MDQRDTLLLLAETYAAATNRSVARVATLAANDGKFFRRLSEGRSCTFPVLNRTIQWFSDHWPSETPWPAGITRPPETDTPQAA